MGLVPRANPTLPPLAKVGVTAKSLDDNVDQNSVASAFNASISLSLAPASTASCYISLVAVANDIPAAAKAASLGLDNVLSGDNNLLPTNSFKPNFSPVPNIP